MALDLEKRPEGHSAADAAIKPSDWLVLYGDRVVIVRGLPTRALHPTWPREEQVALSRLEKVEILPPTWTEAGFVRFRVADADLTHADSALHYAATDTGFSSAVFTEWTTAKRQKAQRAALLQDAKGDRYTVIFRGNGALEEVRSLATAIRDRLRSAKAKAGPPASAGTIRERLVELDRMRESGLLRPGEYETLRERVLREF
jgi:hypothetical protein